MNGSSPTSCLSYRGGIISYGSNNRRRRSLTGPGHFQVRCPLNRVCQFTSRGIRNEVHAEIPRSLPESPKAKSGAMNRIVKLISAIVLPSGQKTPPNRNCLPNLGLQDDPNRKLSRLQALTIGSMGDKVRVFVPSSGGT